MTDALIDFFAEPHNVEAVEALLGEVTVEPYASPVRTETSAVTGNPLAFA